GQVTIDARSLQKTLTVTFRKRARPGSGSEAARANENSARPGSGSEAASTVARTIPLPDDASQRSIETSAVILASNVARDEADDLLVTMMKKEKEKDTQPSRSSSAPSSTASPPPSLSPEQMKALGPWNESAAAYERGAKSYRDTVSAIIKLHYETKKK